MSIKLTSRLPLSSLGLKNMVNGVLLYTLN